MDSAAVAHEIKVYMIVLVLIGAIMLAIVEMAQSWRHGLRRRGPQLARGMGASLVAIGATLALVDLVLPDVPGPLDALVAVVWLSLVAISSTLALGAYLPSEAEPIPANPPASGPIPIVPPPTIGFSGALVVAVVLCLASRRSADSGARDS